jgi:hypothetical protein
MERCPPREGACAGRKELVAAQRETSDPIEPGEPREVLEVCRN